ncbi:efflux RND transporter permease subunit [Methylocystis heyeri]|uniref:MMPL family transporter n=1 Tax=Methylocystis heyeri TaxID=391905 RepID=A0A6B8KHL3_9HYPH|nr:efflux RND transporter permease subunit [Methylocystis heyeri]QGM47099.1 MMPL family transporter [Methylocystis heyeri]
MLAIVRTALQRPYTFVVMAMLILIFGVMSWIKTPTDIFPNIGIPVISVVWTYNGLPPDDMSGRIIYFYERTLTAQVNDIEHIESQSLPGYGIVKVYFQPNVKIDMALAQVTAASQTVLKFLPAGITPPYVLTFNASSVPVLQLALSSDTLTETELFDYGQNFIRPQLATVAGAAIPSPYGGKVRQVQIDIDQRKLQKYGLSAQDVVETIATQNLITPVGTQKIGQFEYIVSLNVSPLQIAELNDLPIKKTEGTILYIRDVAFVHDSSPPQINEVRVDGAPAVLMSIQKSGSASTLDVINGVKALLPKIQASLPKELRLVAVGDQSAFVQAAVAGVIREGAIAAALTGMMILLFLGSWRSTLIITISIPLSILSAITVLSLMGETINVMTLGGFALAVGILVDDATVTIENIDRHLEGGEYIVDAILNGAQEIIIPATVSLLAISIVFVPTFTLGGVAGYLFRPMAEAVILSLIASYILTYTLVPTIARYILAGPHSHGAEGEKKPSTNPLVRFQRGFEHRFERLRFIYKDLLTVALGRPWPFVFSLLGLVVVSFGLAPFLGQNFFPAIEAGQIKLHMRAPIGARIEETSRICDKVETEVRKLAPEGALESIVDNIGLPISGINMAYGNSGTIGVTDADIMITLKPEFENKTDEYIGKLRDELPRLFPGTSFAFLPADIVTQILNFGLPAPIDVQVAGNKTAANRAYAEEIFRKISLVPGVADPRIQQAFNAPTLRVEVDRSRAIDVGLSERDVAASMQNTLAGSIQNAPTFWLNPKTGVSYPIVVQTPQYWMSSLGDLNNMPITSKTGDQLVGAVSGVSREPSNAVVSHYDVQPVIDIYATTHGRDLGAVARDIQSILKDTAKDAPAGARISLRGQVSTMTTAYIQLFGGLALAIVLIYLLIVVNFQSWLDPFVIVSALPTALAGIVWMLFLSFTTLSVPALTGAIMCMGVATANSILVVSFARERLAEGADATTAALDAGFTRFRPVLMTALAMIIGMIPMALSAEQNAPLGRAVIGGLSCATIATLFFVPVVFSLVHKTPHRAQGPAQRES